MQVYFSHSYRDVAINGYFLEHFVDEEIALQADQKTDVWCLAKLERYMGESTGFVSIIPRRPTEADAAGYSPYIGQEHSLARRARLPRLFLIDKQVLSRHRLDFPEDAVPFDPEALESDASVHRSVIRAFRQQLEATPRLSRNSRREDATIVAGEGPALRDGAQDIAEILKREGYRVTLLIGPRPGRGLEDIRLLEDIWQAGLCTFLLESRISDAHIALAMAHAHCIPSVRMQYDPRATECSPSISGMIRWHAREDMLIEFTQQLKSYQEGSVRPVDLAVASTTAEAARSIGTMKWRPRADKFWDVSDGPGLLRHVYPDNTFVSNEVNRAHLQLKRSLGQMFGRENTMAVIRELYNGLQRYRFSYEIEAVTGISGSQAIRTPDLITTHHTATCIDLVCLFASLLEAAGHNPLMVVVEGNGFAHALAGYRVHGEPEWDSRGIDDLLGAVARRDAVLFEATGVAEADQPVGAETIEERRGKLLGFKDAEEAATRIFKRRDIRLRHFIDVRSLRADESRA